MPSGIQSVSPGRENTMAYIRSRTEERTGYQASEGFRPSVDLGCDFVMVYGTDSTMPARVEQYRKAGYAVHLMTGIAWGDYRDYLDGEWDGRDHWDEGQTERDGTAILHGPAVPYMVPTVAFSDYLTEKLKAAVDAGVEAIHVEEPEFWDSGGYSGAFRREYEICYREPWRPQHEDLDVRYKTARLKAYLYCRAIGRVSASLKEYAKARYGRELRFYVPTHSLLNYIQWKILSPEAALLDIPTVDGYIAQIWTGTSRVANVYNGVYRERTFETAFLEYGAMQELVKRTGRRMWFLNDPIEDCPAYTWENYRYNYIKTAVASLLHPLIRHYEVCPWPHRIFEGRYPKEPLPAAETAGPDGSSVRGEEKAAGSDGSAVRGEPIPERYAGFLSGMFQLFGDMDQPEFFFEGVQETVGVFLSDSGLFQRTFPNGIVRTEPIGDRLQAALHRNTGAPVDEEEAAALMREIREDSSEMLDFIQSPAFPQFFGLSMPLLKYGLPVRPVQLDNVRRFAGYLDDCRFLILSYEFIKPEGPDVNMALSAWVRRGGTLICVGDGSDPFHGISSWWRQAGYQDPAAHLFELAGLGRDPQEGAYDVGEGRIFVWKTVPARLCLDGGLADVYRALVKKALAEKGVRWEYRNDLTLHRGPYLISAVMDESVDGRRKAFDGLFADLLENDYRIAVHKEIGPDETALLFDFSRIEGERFRIIATSARVERAEVSERGLRMLLKAADRIPVHTRIRLPHPVSAVRAVDAEGREVPVGAAWDERSRTLLLSWRSRGIAVEIRGDFSQEAAV